MNIKKNTSAAIAGMIVLLSPGISCYHAFAGEVLAQDVHMDAADEGGIETPATFRDASLYGLGMNLNSAAAADLKSGPEINIEAVDEAPTAASAAAPESAPEQPAATAEAAKTTVNTEYLAVLIDKMKSEPHSYPIMAERDNGNNLNYVKAVGETLVFTVQANASKDGESKTEVTVDKNTGEIKDKKYWNDDGIPSLMKEDPVLFVEDEITSVYFKDINEAIEIYRKNHGIAAGTSIAASEAHADAIAGELNQIKGGAEKIDDLGAASSLKATTKDAAANPLTTPHFNPSVNESDHQTLIDTLEDPINQKKLKNFLEGKGFDIKKIRIDVLKSWLIMEGSSFDPDADSNGYELEISQASKTSLRVSVSTDFADEMLEIPAKKAPLHK